ncbi:hypothetical protein N7517_001613 [Penicillium concentricum]|uniref:Uncharacterized protein n=1 Tax=Penicillium concentricum TaxID=293559 RepID=A0A9W9SSB8_9EURO|nr:uncharacterized protein N7517_001613 [Penicillium concentricum]KAJ5383702.1 hypothetical protein N7517_001613 [Penicillium concentricum]
MDFLSDSDEDFKPESFQPFTPDFDIVQRWRWLNELYHKFSRPPYTSMTDKMKIIIATNRLCNTYRERWQLLKEWAPPEERERLKTWKAFEEWTLTLLNISGEFGLVEMYTNARHKPSQDPSQFRTYLCAIEAELEKQFEPRSQKEQSLTFLVKLDPELQCDTRQGCIGSKGQLPENLPEMVRLASARWRARKSALEIMHQADHGKGSGSSRGNHRGRARCSRNRRGRGNISNKQQIA